MVRKVNPCEIDSAMKQENEEFYGDSVETEGMSELLRKEHWEPMMAKYKEGDQIWFYRFPDRFWENLMGSQGYALIRDGKCISEFRTKWN